MSTPTTLVATVPSSALPYPSPHAASRTRFPATNWRANTYRCQCSYAISPAQPGTKRSPVKVMSETMRGQFEARRSPRRRGENRNFTRSARSQPPVGRHRGIDAVMPSMGDAHQAQLACVAFDGKRLFDVVEEADAFGIERMCPYQVFARQQGQRRKRQPE